MGVVKMSGTLRRDLYQRMKHTAESADMVLSLGTSLSGLCSDMVATTCAEKAENGEAVQGLVIVSLQQTKQDDNSSLRIFAKLDDVMGMLADRLKLKMPTAQEIKVATANPDKWYTYMYK